MRVSIPTQGLALEPGPLGETAESRDAVGLGRPPVETLSASLRMSHFVEGALSSEVHWEFAP